MTNLAVFKFTIITVDQEGQPQSSQPRSAESYIEDLAGTSLELVAIPAGTFLMGAPRTEEGWHSTQTPQHLVTIAPFSMGKYPITQAQWSAVAALPKINSALTSSTSCFTGENRPVEQISWDEAIEFCARLSQQTGRTYRLPSEAEWEYACRAGTTTPFHLGATITTDLANYSGINWEYQGKICSKGCYGNGQQGADRRETIDVGSLNSANEFGLYDMHGQVREWCQDCWHSSYEGAPLEGKAWLTGGDCNQRVLRGGSWNNGPKACRSAFRGKLDPNSHLYDVGFRVVCSIDARSCL